MEIIYKDSLTKGFFKNTINSFFVNPDLKARRHHTPKRLWNLLKVYLQILLRKDKAMGFPTYLVVESTNMCNLKCPLCPTGQGLNGRLKGKMSLENFKKIIDKIGAYAYSVRLENWGEPLLNEEVFDMVEYAKTKGINTSFNTNLCYLDEESCEKLILSGLEHIKISLDGASEETYSKYRIGGNFKRVIENIRLLLSMRSKLNSNTPFIEVQFIVMKHNEEEIQKTEGLCRGLGVDRLTFENLRLDMREELFSRDDKLIEKFNDWLPTNSRYSNFDYNKKTRKTKPKICAYLWTTCVVNWDGAIVPCCSVYDPKFDFGNVLELEFDYIWNGDKYRASRRLIGQGKKIKEDTVCLSCFKRGIIT